MGVKQQKSGQGKIKNEKLQIEFEQLLDNPDNQIKRIDQLESQSKTISKPLGKRIAEGYEQLRNLRTTSYFANEDQAVQGGIA
jgi:ferritin-like metal-binding protein YciE